MKILTIQNKVFETVEENLKHIEDLLKKKKNEKFDFIVLPEMFMTPYELKYFKKNRQNKQSTVLKELSKIAKQFNTYLIGGSIPEEVDDKIYNSTYIFDRQGHILAHYKKIHLFSVTYPNGTKFSESDVLSAGHQIVTFNTEFGKMGVMICFDIRFPYLAQKLRELDTKIIFVPAAFNTYTGPLHWHTTFRARAIDNQMFFVAASPSRDSYGSYEPYGHSLVVDPFGRITHELKEFENLMTATIDLSIIDKARKSIPIVSNEIDIEKIKVKKY